MVKYKLTTSRDVHLYECQPEIVIFDLLSKETMLFVSFSAGIIRFLLSTPKVLTASIDELKEKSMEYCHANIEDFDDCLEQLLQMNIIELAE